MSPASLQRIESRFSNCVQFTVVDSIVTCRLTLSNVICTDDVRFQLTSCLLRNIVYAVRAASHLIGNAVAV